MSRSDSSLIQILLSRPLKAEEDLQRIGPMLREAIIPLFKNAFIHGFQISFLTMFAFSIFSLLLFTFVKQRRS